MELKTPEEIAKEMSNAYLHEDNETIDIIVDTEDKSFIEELLQFNCPRCTESIIKGNEKLTRQFTEHVSGIQIKCNTCEQKLFVHKPVFI